MDADRVAGRATMICGRQKRVVPAPRCRCQDGDKQARSHRGARAISRNTIAQGRPDDFGGPVVTCSCAFSIRTRGYGCAEHPAFPAPSRSSRDISDANLGCTAPREGGAVSFLLGIGSGRRVGKAIACPPFRYGIRRGTVGTALARLCPPYEMLRFAVARNDGAGCLTSQSESATGLICVHQLRTA